MDIPIDQVQPSRHQARKQFDEASIKALAESIKEEGLLQPIAVRQVDGGYELIGGERRLRAAKLLGWTSIDAKIIQTVSEGEAAVKGLIENLQREDLNPIEEAEGFKELLDLKDVHWTQAKIASVTGKGENRISESLGLLNLPKDVIEAIRQRKITSTHGVELLRLNNANSIKGMANKIIKGGWSVKKTREAVEKKLNNFASPGLRPPSPSGRGAGGEAKPLTDPLASRWSQLQSNPPSGAAADWQVDYGPEETWNFKTKLRGADYETFMAMWFDQMAEALRPLATPRFTEARLDATDGKIHLSWALLPGVKSYELHYSFNYPTEPLKPMRTDLPIFGPQFALSITTPGKTEVWLALRSLAGPHRASPISEPVHIKLG